MNDILILIKVQNEEDDQEILKLLTKTSFHNNTKIINKLKKIIIPKLNEQEQPMISGNFQQDKDQKNNEYDQKPTHESHVDISKLSQKEINEMLLKQYNDLSAQINIQKIEFKKQDIEFQEKFKNQDIEFKKKFKNQKIDLKSKILNSKKKSNSCKLKLIIKQKK